MNDSLSFECTSGPCERFIITPHTRSYISKAPHNSVRSHTSQASLVEQIARLVDEGKIGSVSDVRDESDRTGMRVVVELKRGE